MLVQLTHQNRIDGNAGDIVEVSPARAAFLFETKSAVPAAAFRERKAEPVKTAPAKTAAKTTTAKKTTTKSKK